MSKAVKCAAFLLASALGAEVKLATFDGAKGTTATWQVTNDPVMGGQSTSTFAVTGNKTGLFKGTCAIVKFLKAPGFAKIQATHKFGDITGYDSIAMKVKSSTPDFKGFKMAFSAPKLPKAHFFGFASYKAGFTLTGSDWQVVEVPLTLFSRDWSSYTGRCDTKDPGLFGSQHYCCDKSGEKPSKPEVCVEAKYLSKIDQLELWAEGVKGDFNLEVEWVGASKKSLEAQKASGEEVTLV